MSTARHRAEYSGESHGKDHKARGFYNRYGYLIASFRPGNPYGKHSRSRRAI